MCWKKENEYIMLRSEEAGGRCRAGTRKRFMNGGSKDVQSVDVMDENAKVRVKWRQMIGWPPLRGRSKGREVEEETMLKSSFKNKKMRNIDLQFEAPLAPSKKQLAQRQTLSC